jgi:hypothetical protein
MDPQPVRSVATVDLDPTPHWQRKRSANRGMRAAANSEPPELENSRELEISLLPHDLTLIATESVQLTLRPRGAWKSARGRGGS